LRKRCCRRRERFLAFPGIMLCGQRPTDAPTISSLEMVAGIGISLSAINNRSRGPEEGRPVSSVWSRTTTDQQQSTSRGGAVQETRSRARVQTRPAEARVWGGGPAGRPRATPPAARPSSRPSANSSRAARRQRHRSSSGPPGPAAPLASLPDSPSFGRRLRPGDQLWNRCGAAARGQGLRAAGDARARANSGGTYSCGI
jgi:hypothetical protein